MNLCVACATRSLGEGLAGTEVARLIGELVTRISPGLGASAETTAVAVPDATRHCVACGLTASEFAHLGRLGCPACYEALAAEVDGVLRASQKGDEHKGSRPPSVLAPAMEPAPAEVAERELLQVELEQAVAEEAFERAAQLRDALRRLH